MSAEAVSEIVWETVSVADLKPHPRNYRAHPADQLEHIAASLEEHGQYRNVVVAADYTILAGHGVVEAAVKNLGWTELRVGRVDVEPFSATALKILTGDNEIGRLAEIDDRLLTEHLKTLSEMDSLLGTGFDDATLANLVFVTRHASEIQTVDEAAQWVGLPEFAGIDQPYRLIIQFDTVDERQQLMDLAGIDYTHYRNGKAWSAWWPPRRREDLASLRFTDAAPEEVPERNAG